MKLVVLFLEMFIGVTIVNSESPIYEFVKSNHQFTTDLYKAVTKMFPDKNFVFTPLSIELILALIRSGANGTTASEIASALSLPDIGTTETALGQILPALKNSTGDIKVSTANKLYVQKKFNILDTFRDKAVTHYEADVENIDFNNPQNASEIINKWVEEQTNNKIKNLIDPDNVDPSTNMILVNTIHFLGSWLSNFRIVRKGDFYVSKSEIRKMDMMQQRNTFRYYKCNDTNTQFIEIPYVDKHFTMTIILPSEVDGFTDLEDNIHKAFLPKDFKRIKVFLKIPKFKIENNIDLKPILRSMGIESLFSGADLTGITTDNAVPLLFDEAIQRAVIDVSENGTEAAGATTFKLPSRSLLNVPAINFVVNHPFLYFIKYKSIVLFAGRKIN